MKTSISDHFKIFAVTKFLNKKKRIYNKKFEELNVLNSTNTLYKHFMQIYSNIYDENIALLETEEKLKD